MPDNVITEYGYPAPLILDTLLNNVYLQITYPLKLNTHNSSVVFSYNLHGRDINHIIRFVIVLFKSRHLEITL